MPNVMARDLQRGMIIQGSFFDLEASRWEVVTVSQADVGGTDSRTLVLKSAEGEVTGAHQTTVPSGRMYNVVG